MKGRAGLALSLAVLVAAALASTAGAGSTANQASAATQATSCTGTIKLAIITPLTGDAGFLGQEQLSWAKLAVKRLARSRATSSSTTRWRRRSCRSTSPTRA
jgi:hypothetical protein